MDDETSVKLLLQQPTRRREWELRQGEELVAELSLPAMRSGGRGSAAGRELEIRTQGILRREHVVADAATGEELARVRGHAVELRGIESAEWKSLGRDQGSGLVGPGGEPWLRAKVKSGAFRTMNSGCLGSRATSATCVRSAPCTNSDVVRSITTGFCST